MHDAWQYLCQHWGTILSIAGGIYVFIGLANFFGWRYLAREAKSFPLTRRIFLSDVFWWPKDVPQWFN